MISKDVNKLLEILSVLRGCYPDCKLSEPERRAVSLQYFKAMRDLDLDDIGAAAMVAAQPEYYPEAFPTIDQLRRVVHAEQQRRQYESSRERTERQRNEQDEQIRRCYHEVPVGMLGQKQYIDDATTPFERVARRLEVETVKSRRDPAGEAPGDVAKRWQKEIRDTWASVPSKAIEGEINPNPSKTNRRAS